MATRKLAAVVAVFVTGFAAMDGAHAQTPVTGTDGCVTLAALVYTEVTAARLSGSRAVDGLRTYPARDDDAVCNHTARSVTRAFASSLRQMNIHIAWGSRPDYAGDYCLSHDLSQCYPGRSPYLPALSVTDTAFVMHAWRAVRGAVNRARWTNPASDVVRFNRAQLSGDIRATLSTLQPAGGQADTAQ